MRIAALVGSHVPYASPVTESAINHPRRAAKERTKREWSLGDVE